MDEDDKDYIKFLINYYLDQTVLSIGLVLLLAGLVGLALTN